MFKVKRSVLTCLLVLMALALIERYAGGLLGAMAPLVRLAVVTLAMVNLMGRRGFKWGEAIALGVSFTFLIFSLLYQLAFLCGRPELSLPGEWVLFLFSLGYVLATRNTLRDAGTSLWRMVRAYPVFSCLLGAGLAYLLLQAILVPPGNYDSITYNLSRVLLFQQEHSLILTDVTTERQAIFPLGSDILAHMFLRYHQDYGIAIFAFLSYLAIGAGTYALARRFTRQEFALTAVAVVLSMQELVFQATSTKSSIIVSMLIITVFLLLARISSAFRFRDFLYLLLLLAFGIAVKTTWIFFLAPMLLLYVSVFLHADIRHEVWGTFRRYPIRGILFIGLGMILGGLWIFIVNYFHWGGWLGPEYFSKLNRQHDGLMGAIANMVRYLFQMVDPLPLVVGCWHHVTGHDMMTALQWLYDKFCFPWIGTVATNSTFGPFVLCCRSAEDFTWFGPFGALLAFPAVLWSGLRFRGRPNVARMAWTLIGYVVLLSFLMNWTPWNNRYMSCFFVPSGVCIAIMLRDLRMPRWGLGLIRALAMVFLLYACVFNELKPLLLFPGATVTCQDMKPRHLLKGLLHRSIWAQTKAGKDRWYFARTSYGDDRVAEFGRYVPSGSTVGLITGEDSPVYHYFLLYPSMHFIPLRRLWPDELSAKGIQYVLGIDKAPTLDNFASAQLLWKAKPGTRGGSLFKLTP